MWYPKLTRLFLRAALLILVLTLFYWPIAYGSKVLFFADNLTLMMPMRMIFREAVRSGELPWWNPYVMGGMPLLGESSMQTFYPPAWLFVLVPEQWLGISLNWYALLSVLWGGLGTWYLLELLSPRSKRWGLLASVIWIGSSYQVSVMNNVVLFSSFAWGPWMMFSLLRHLRTRTAISRVFAILVVILGWGAGHPQPWVYAGIVAGVFLAVEIMTHWTRWGIRRLFGYLLEVLGMVVLVSMTLAFPLSMFIEMIQESTRSVMLSEDVVRGSLHPLLLVHWILPQWFSNPFLGLTWGPEWNMIKQTHGYVSVFGLIACFFAFFRMKGWIERVVVWGAIVSVVFAMGEFIPGIAELYVMLPGLQALRNPSAALVIWGYLAPLAVAIGASSAWSWVENSQLIRSRWWIGALALITWFSAVTSSWWADELWNLANSVLKQGLENSFFTMDRAVVILQNSLLSVSFLTAMAALVLLVLSRSARTDKPLGNESHPSKLHAFLLIAVVFLDLRLANASMMQYGPKSLYELRSSQVDWLFQQEDLSRYRIASSTDMLAYTGFTSYYHDMVTFPPFSSSTRFTSEEQETFSELFSRRNNLGSNWNGVAGISSPWGYATFVLQDAARYWHAAVPNREGAWQSSINFLPMVPPGHPSLAEMGVRWYLLDGLIYGSDAFEQLAPNLVKRHSEDQFSVYEDLAAQPVVRLATERTNSFLEIEKQSMNGYSLKLELEQADELEIRQWWYPGWRCDADSFFCRVNRAETGMSISVPQGSHVLRVWYEPRHLWIFSSISMVGIALILGQLGVRNQPV